MKSLGYILFILFVDVFLLAGFLYTILEIDAYKGSLELINLT